MKSITVSASVSSAIIILFFAYVYKRHVDIINVDNNLQIILDGLLNAENSAKINDTLRIAVGFGSCVDLIVPGLEVLEKLQAQSPDLPEHFDCIQNQLELEKVFSYFFRHGAAAERYMNNTELFDKICDIAHHIPSSHYEIGGSAPLMLRNFQGLGLKVLLGAQMSNHLRKLIGDEVEVVGSEVEKDDVHLIFEYNKGESWGQYTTPRANRFIIHNDHSNPMLSSLENFSETLKSFNPDLVVVGGLHMMDNHPFAPGVRKARLNKLVDILSSLDTQKRVHFEMSSFSQQECLQDVMHALADHVDSFGMNEQELPNLLGIVLDGSITLVSDPTPRIATSLDQMRKLWNALRSGNFNKKKDFSNQGESKLNMSSNFKRTITRLHVHTLAFQAIMTEKDAGWKNSMSATAKAALTANRHTCGSNIIKIDKSRLLLDDSFATSNEEDVQRRIFIDPHDPVSCWLEGNIEICLAPVLVCTDVVQTVGGGDNISSSGLVLQL